MKMSIEDLARHGEQIEKRVEEIQALRAWKAKARPFLEERLSILKSEIRCVNAMMIGSLKSDAIEHMEKRLEDLTELLKEGE